MITNVRHVIHPGQLSVSEYNIDAIYDSKPPNEYCRTRIALRLPQRLSRFCTDFRAYCSITEQKIAKRPTAIIRDTRRRRTTTVDLQTLQKKLIMLTVRVFRDQQLPKLWTHTPVIGKLATFSYRNSQKEQAN